MSKKVSVVFSVAMLVAVLTISAVTLPLGMPSAYANTSLRHRAMPSAGEQAVDNGGCSKYTPILNSRVKACISRPQNGVVVADAYVTVASPSPCDSCRGFRLLLWQDLPWAFDRVWKVENFPYRSAHISLPPINVSKGRYYADLWVMEGGVVVDSLESPRQVVY